MPKLLQINVRSNCGSTSRIAEHIGLRAKASGWDSYLAYGRDNNPSQLKLIKIENKLSVYWHYIEAKLFDREGLSSRLATLYLVRKIKSIKPDIILLHNIHDHWLNYKILFRYLNKTSIPVIWTFHDCWAFTGHCFHFVEIGCDKWKNQCGKCPLKSGIVDRSRQNYILKKNIFNKNRNLTIVPVSEWMAKFVRESYLKNKNIQVIHNGVDTNVFRPHYDTINNDGKFRILAVSSVWTKSKGIADIIRLRTLLPERFIITVVGLSEEQIKGFPSGIEGIRRTKNLQELVQYYSSADVFINTTYADTFPTVNLEALACGTPVITYRTGGSPEAVDEKTGIVINQGDVEALASSILSIERNPLNSDDCRKRAVDFFDKDKCFDEYIKLFTSLIK